MSPNSTATIRKHRPLVFLDIETTGLSPDTSRVLEIGAIRVENGKAVQTYKQLIHPETPVPPFITRLTGISDTEVDGQPRFTNIAAGLTQLLDGAVFVAHNVDFDYGFIKMEYARLGLPFNYDRLCTVKLSRALYSKERSHKLDAIITRHGYTVADRHRALDDAEVLYKFFIDSHAAFGLEIFKHMDRLVSYARPSQPHTHTATVKLPLQ